MTGHGVAGPSLTGPGATGRADLHLHSLASDGTAGIDEILAAAVGRTCR